MINQRKMAFDNISRILAITRYDIEQHQVINDLSLNIHGENFFRDVFNFIYGYNLVNANFETGNSPCIDLINKKNKLAYQITTTRTKEKIEKTLQALVKPEYKDFDIKIFYLLEKANPKDETLTVINSKYSINLQDCLLDYTDLINDIHFLEENKLVELNDRYFKGKENRYTDDIVLDLTFRHLLSNFRKSSIKYYNNDDFGNVDINKKLQINNIYTGVCAEIIKGSDYKMQIDNISEQDNLLTHLSQLIIDNLYSPILKDSLSYSISKSQLNNKNTQELHALAIKNDICFNTIINKLHSEIENKIEIKDFNSMNIAWIIIAYFFEICDIGVHDDNAN